MKKLGIIVTLLIVLTPMRGKEFFPIQMYHINRNWIKVDDLQLPRDTLLVSRTGVNLITHAYPTWWWLKNFWSARMLESAIHQLDSRYDETHWYGRLTSLIGTNSPNPFFPISLIEDSLALWNHLADALVETLWTCFQKNYNDPNCYGFWVIDNDGNWMKMGINRKRMKKYAPAAESLCAKLKRKDSLKNTIHYNLVSEAYLDDVPSLDIIHTGPLALFCEDSLPTEPNYTEYVQRVFDALIEVSDTLSKLCKGYKKSWMGYLNIAKKKIGDIWYRHPTEEELRAISYISLAYGAQGLFYYKYDSYNPNTWGWGLISPEGKPYMPKNPALIDSIFGPSGLDINDVDSTYSIYSDFWRVIRDVRAHGLMLKNMEWEGAASLHKTSLPWRKVININGATYVEMAEFSGEHGSCYMFVNRHTRPGDTKTLTITFDVGRPYTWCLVKDLWDPTYSMLVRSDALNRIQFQKTLKPGDACVMQIISQSGPVSSFDRMTAYNTGRKDLYGGITWTGNADSVFFTWGGLPGIYLGHGRYPASALAGEVVWPNPQYFDIPIWAWIDTSGRHIYYRYGGSSTYYELPLPAFGGSYYLSPPSIATADDRDDTVFVACIAFYQDSISSSRIFSLLYWKFHYRFPELAQRGVVHEWDGGEGTVFRIDTLGVALGVSPSYDPSPPALHIYYNSQTMQYEVEETLPYHPTPYFIWIEDGDIWQGRVRYGYWPQGHPEVWNVSDSLEDSLGIILRPFKEVSGGMFDWNFNVVSIKDTGIQDTLFWITEYVPCFLYDTTQYPPLHSWNYPYLIGGAPVIVAPASESISYPSLARNTWVLWQQKNGTNPFEIYSRAMDWLLETWHNRNEIENVSGSSNDSRYPHGSVWVSPLDPFEINRTILWTERIGTNQYQVMRHRRHYYVEEPFPASPLLSSPNLSKNYQYPLIPALYIRGGADKGFSPCIHRDTFKVFNQEIYGKVDIGVDSLTYLLFRLYPERNYGIMVEIYFESDSDSLWKALLDIDGVIKDTMEFRAGCVRRFWQPILPKELYQNDGKVVIQLRRLKGDYVSCSRIIVWDAWEPEE